MRTLTGILLMGALSLPLAASAAEPEEGAEAQKGTEGKAGCQPIRLHFELDSATIDDSQKAALDQAAQCLSENEKLRVFVEGNTDSLGSHEYNRQLGAKRSAAVADYLKGKGVQSSQLQQISFGEGNPVCSGKSESCLQENRNTALRPACKL